MHLTIVNLFKKTVPGHIFRGKRRLVKKVSCKALITLRQEYEREEQIMALLRHPYLTVEESRGHVKHLEKSEQKISNWNEQSNLRRMKPHVTIEERLNHLIVKEAWD